MENYGSGPSTGLDQTAAGKIVTGFSAGDLSMSPADRDVLRALAEQVAEIAGSQRMAETRRLWKRVNSLEPARPVVFCDPENGWNEIITESQMQCTGKLARRWEMDLRKEIFWGTEMGDDKPVEPTFDVPYTVSPDDWGLQAEYLEDKYIMSIKPNPATSSTPQIDEDAIRRDLRAVLDATTGCVVELIMKDNHTLGNRPENAVRWCQIAREEADRKTQQ